MKYYESHFDDYISAIEKHNIHPELLDRYKKLPDKISKLENLIIYGPSGCGKYSQILYLLKRYSANELKYEKKITANTEKQNYTYKLSDIHYEIDMSLLGCNSKILWHEIFFQIVDIISVKQEKVGIIVCKNFHLIHTELLEIFYSYMQQYNNTQSHIQIKFFIMTEHLSFLPTPIINACQILKIGRPRKEHYVTITNSNSIPNKNTIDDNASHDFVNRISDYKPKMIISNNSNSNIEKLFNSIELDGVMNIKDTRYFDKIENQTDLPKEVFNIVCDNIIQDMESKKKLNFTEFRDTLYEILTYNLDAIECLSYIIQYFIETNRFNKKDISDVLEKTYVFLKYYNNNYRPIYHLESIMFYIINKIHKHDEL
jgi:hypothetical protein